MLRGQSAKREAEQANSFNVGTCDGKSDVVGTGAANPPTVLLFEAPTRLRSTHSGPTAMVSRLFARAVSVRLQGCLL